MKISLIQKTEYEILLRDETSGEVIHLRYAKNDETLFLQRELHVEEITLDNKKARRKRLQNMAGLSGGKGDLMAVMPGRVVSVMKTVGEKVKEGETVLVMEAMKMENEFKAPFDGVMASVSVKVGESVESGALLASVEENV
jgi:biotin carboxyl carrier protein